MNRMPTFAATLLCCVLLSRAIAAPQSPVTAPTAPPATVSARLTADLQAIIERFLAANAVAPGVSARVICPRLGLDWSGAAGTEARGSQEPLTPAHTFRTASNTKTYMAAAVLRLAEQGRIGLDDPLAKWLPEDERTLLAGDGYDLDAMTVRQVLSHTSGLNEHPSDERFTQAIIADPQHKWTREEQIQRCVEWCDPVGAPGERYYYSDTGYVILGGIVERITGRNLGAAVRELLDYQRLGLAATWWEYMEKAPATAGPRAHQYFGNGDVTGWYATFDLYGGGGLVSDVDDLALFMRQLLKGRVLHDEASLAAMTGGGTPSYRLGLMCVELGGYQAWGHQGFWNTFAFHVPSLDLTVAGNILNHDAKNGRALADELVARVAAAAP